MHTPAAHSDATWPKRITKLNDLTRNSLLSSSFCSWFLVFVVSFSQLLALSLFLSHPMQRDAHLKKNPKLQLLNYVSVSRQPYWRKKSVGINEAHSHARAQTRTRARARSQTQFKFDSNFLINTIYYLFIFVFVVCRWSIDRLVCSHLHKYHKFIHASNFDLI